MRIIIHIEELIAAAPVAECLRKSMDCDYLSAEAVHQLFGLGLSVKESAAHQLLGLGLSIKVSVQVT